MIEREVLLNYYQRKDIQKELVESAADKEAVAKFSESFSKRPDVLRNANDVLELARNNATSFHASEELWKNPLQIDPSMKRTEIDKLRIGWDLIIDIDCPVFDYSKIAADLVVKALKFHKIKSVTCKFSGNKGFHIGVPFQSFPEKIRNEETKNMFPEAPKKIALYIKSMILDEFGKRILEFEKNDFNKIIEKTGRKNEELITSTQGSRKFNPDPILQMDTLLISSRHLYRMPYSLHEKSGLASIPINPDEILGFKKESALPRNVRADAHKFLDRSFADENEAKQLLQQALDFGMKQEEATLKFERSFEQVQDAIPEEFFPPCIKLILKGIDDGKKRALFILVNYFTSIGWSYESIEKILVEWNKRNKDPIRETYLLGQLRYHKQMKKKILPPNCSNEMYMKGINVCRPDNFCPRIKNPAQYSIRKAWLVNKSKPKKKKGK